MVATGRRLDRRLLAPGERWGWEYRLGLDGSALAGPTAASCDDDAPPGDAGVPAAEPDWTAPAADRYARAVRHRGRYWRAAAGAGALTVLLAALAAVVRWPGMALGALLLAAVAVACVGLATVPPLRAVRAADTAYRQWAAACRAAHDRAPDWHADPPRVDPGAAGSVGYSDRWRPVRPTAAERIDVYGGTDRGWAALLSTVAGSMLGSGAAVTVLDLTGRSAGRDLIRLAGSAGHRLDLLSLPDHLPAVGLLSDLTPAQVGTVLAEAVHAVDRDPDSGDRSSDATLIGQAVAALRGPLTFRRLAGALRLLDGAHAGDDGLTPAERANLAAALRQPGNASAGPRLRRLAAAAGQLALLEEHDPGVRPYRDPHAQLRVMQLLGDDPELSTGLLAQVLAGVLLHQVRRQVPAEGPGRLLVVAGADGLRRTQLERLDQLTRRRRIRLVLLYQRLRADAVAPTGSHATLLMRQGSDAAAERAVELTGPGHELLVSDFTAAHRTSVGSSTSDIEAAGRLDPPPALPSLPPHPCGAVPTGAPRAGTRYAVTPGFLRELSETAYLMLDPRDPGGPRLVECDLAVLS